MAIPSNHSNPLPMPLTNVHVKEEHDSSPSTSPLSSPTNPIKTEQHDDLTITHNHDASEIFNSVNQLANLAAAITNFKAVFDDLQNHLDFIDKAIESNSKHLSSAPSAEPNSEETEKSKENAENNIDGGGPHGDVVSHCRAMCSRGLRKYVMGNLLELEKLREEVPQALKVAPRPAKLVLECIGRFFLQGSRAYIRDSPMIPARQVSVLILEYFLLSGCVGDVKDMGDSLKEEARMAACAWKKRLVVEGGVCKACEIDARGLILFVGCFGIPVSFRNEEVRDLVRLSNPREIMRALRQSPGLVKKVLDITDVFMKKGSVAEAVDLAYVFGFEEKLSPQTNLTSFLQKSEDSWKKTRKEARGSATALKQADENYLAALRSVLNCLEGHKIDHTTFLPGSKLKEKISNLEKDIDKANRKIQDKAAAKRKMDRNDCSEKLKAQELKRSRLNLKDPSIVSSPVSLLQEHRINSRMDGNSLYDTSLRTHMLLNSRPSSHLNNYSPASSLQFGSVAGPLSDSVYGATLAAEGGNLIGAGIGGTNDIISRYLGETAVENIDIYRRLGIRESVLSHERLVGQPSSARLSSLYGVALPSRETFAGLPDHSSLGSVSRTSGADLYHFADAIYEPDSLHASSSAKAANSPQVLSANDSPYMY